MPDFLTANSRRQPGAVALEDSIMQKGFPAAAGSAALNGFISPVDAEVVSRLAGAGVDIAGRVSMREFGLEKVMQDTGESITDAVEVVRNGVCENALCNDLFGIYRREAADADLGYIQPTYATVSRYGLIPVACSMDQIGIVCSDIAGGFRLLSLIAGKDEKDPVMFPDKNYVYNRSRKKPTVAVPKAIVSMADESTQNRIADFSSRFEFVDIDIEYFHLFKQTVYILSCAEAGGNLSRYDGVKFGHRASSYGDINELYTKTRTESFGSDAKLALIIGSLVLSKEYYTPLYKKAMSLRRLIKNSLDFNGYDIIALPAGIQGGGYENLAFCGFTSLAGLPSLTFSYNGGSIQLVAAARNEAALLAAYEEVSKR